jgi:hypothetical protein
MLQLVSKTFESAQEGGEAGSKNLVSRAARRELSLPGAGGF